MLTRKIKVISNLVVLPHSVFALPFALASLFTVTQGKPSLKLLLLVILAMVLARTTSMAYNRLEDADIDTKNPRTKNRDIPAGRISRLQVKMLILACGLAFIVTCYFLNRLALYLSPVALLIVFFYTHTKRFTWTSHLFLGLALGVAPVGAWIAATGRFDLEPLWLAAAVICFLAGFDILYATLDLAFDLREGLHSWVVRWGIANSLAASRFFHSGMLGFLAAFGYQVHFPQVYYIGLCLVGALLVFEHLKAYTSKKRPGGIEFKLNPAMMLMNGWVSTFYLVVVCVTVWL
jgi:4-hydroxybenzoate polyprenyltransferase